MLLGSLVPWHGCCGAELVAQVVVAARAAGRAVPSTWAELHPSPRGCRGRQDHRLSPEYSQRISLPKAFSLAVRRTQEIPSSGAGLGRQPSSAHQSPAPNAEPAPIPRRTIVVQSKAKWNEQPGRRFPCPAVGGQGEAMSPGAAAPHLGSSSR